MARTIEPGGGNTRNIAGGSRTRDSFIVGIRSRPRGNRRCLHGHEKAIGDKKNKCDYFLKGEPEFDFPVTPDIEEIEDDRRYGIDNNPYVRVHRICPVSHIICGSDEFVWDNQHFTKINTEG